MHKQEILYCIFGIIFGGLVTHILISTLGDTQHSHNKHHPIADPYDSEYHVHADFHIVINNVKLDLSKDQFQTTGNQQLHPDLHLHDNNGDVKHIHAEDKTFVEFLASLDITLGTECITSYTGEQFCIDEENDLHLYVNNELYTSMYDTYIPVDNDRILVYYGTRDTERIQRLLDAVPDEACIYSGTCPERGIAPPESCGLTCEL